MVKYDWEVCSLGSSNLGSLFNPATATLCNRTDYDAQCGTAVTMTYYVQYVTSTDRAWLLKRSDPARENHPQYGRLRWQIHCLHLNLRCRQCQHTVVAESFKTVEQVQAAAAIIRELKTTSTPLYLVAIDTLTEDSLSCWQTTLASHFENLAEPRALRSLSHHLTCQARASLYRSFPVGPGSPSQIIPCSSISLPSGNPRLSSPSTIRSLRLAPTVAQLPCRSPRDPPHQCSYQNQLLRLSGFRP